MIEIYISIILGIITGIITGLIPGLHVNTVGIIIFSLSDKITQYTSVISLCSFFVTIAICHSMIEFIPSLLFGVATEDTLTSIQPGHRLLFKGQANKAIRLVSFGGYFSIIILIVLMPLLFIILPIAYSLLKNYIGILLVATMIIMLYYTNKSNIKRLYSSLIFIVSGILGLIVLNSNLGGNLALLTLLSGLFSISSLLYSINEKSVIPPQESNENIVIDKNFKKSTFAGSISGCILGLLPGLGPAQGTIIAQTLTFNKNITPEDFIVTNSGVNVSDTLFSLIAIYLINNPRSAISVYVSNLLNDVTLAHVIFFIFISLVTASIACILSIKIGDYVIKRINRINYRNTSILLVILITLVVMIYCIYSGGCLWYVILCFITSISLGILPNVLDISKSNLMGILIVPAIITYLGLL